MESRTRQKRSSGGHRRSSDATPSGTQISNTFRRLPVSITPRAAPSARAVARQFGGGRAVAGTAEGAAAIDSGCSSTLAAAASDQGLNGMGTSAGTGSGHHGW